jgi:hypothetical protein
VLKDILDYYIVQEKNMHLDHFTQGEEIIIWDIPLLSQQSTFNLKSKKHLEEERVNYETMPSMMPNNP